MPADLKKPNQPSLPGTTSPPPNGEDKPPPNTMDPMLRAAGKLDRLLAKMPEDVRTWALAYLQIKYKAKT